MDLPSLNLSNPFLDPLLHSSVIAAHTDAAWQPHVRPCAYGRAQENLRLLKENTNVRKPGPSEPSFPLTPLSRPWFLSSSAHHGSHVLSLLPSPSSSSLQGQMLQEAWPARCSLLRSTLLATSCSPWAVVSTSKAGFKMVPTLYVTQAEVGWEWCRWASQKPGHPSSGCYDKERPEGQIFFLQHLCASILWLPWEQGKKVPLKSPPLVLLLHP